MTSSFICDKSVIHHRMIQDYTHFPPSSNKGPFPSSGSLSGKSLSLSRNAPECPENHRGECIPEPQTFRGRETQSSDGGSLLLRPWEDAHGGLNTRTGRRSDPEGRGFDGALVSTTMYSRPSSLPATTREDPRPCLLPTLGSGWRTADKPPPARTTPRSLASLFRHRHTRGPWCPSLPPPVLLPAPALAHPIPPVRHATSSRKSAWTAGDYASLICVSTTSTASGKDREAAAGHLSGQPFPALLEQCMKRDSGPRLCTTGPPAHHCSRERNGSAATRLYPPRPRCRL